MCIKTERLEMRPYKEEDRDAMMELLTNEEIKQTFMIQDFKNKQDLEKMFQKLKDYSYCKDHYVRGIFLDNMLIGFINDVEIKDGIIELGYVIHPSQKGNGYATEAVGAVINELFAMGYRKVVAAAFPENAASFRVMEKCGMIKTERYEKVYYHGKDHVCPYYAIIKKTE